MKDEYLDFAINQIENGIKENKQYIYVGWIEEVNKEIDLNIPMIVIPEFIETLKEYAIEEEKYEYIRSSQRPS